MHTFVVPIAGALTIPEVCYSKREIAVQLPAFRSDICPMGVHKAHEASTGMVEREGTHVVSYIDDMLLLAHLEEAAARQVCQQ